jgi:hypothetical protein
MTERYLYGNEKQESPPTPSSTQLNLSFFSPLFLASNTIALHPQREREVSFNSKLKKLASTSQFPFFPFPLFLFFTLFNRHYLLKRFFFQFPIHIHSLKGSFFRLFNDSPIEF